MSLSINGVSSWQEMLALFLAAFSLAMGWAAGGYTFSFLIGLLRRPKQ